MSILINGMKMPKSCYECRLGYSLLGKRCMRTGTLVETGDALKGRLPTCPLIELQPHGRLIDADALIKDGWRLQRQVKIMGGTVLHEMPLNHPSIKTIVEAEEASE